MLLRKFRHNKNRRGLTLIEILIVISLMSLLGLASYNALSNGIRVWQRSQRQVLEEDILLFFEKVTSDVRNTFMFSTVSFEGGLNRVSFPTLFSTASGQGIIKVEFYFDYNQQGIYKRIADYGQAMNREFGQARPLVSGIENCTFRYWFITDTGEKTVDEVSGQVPSGLEITVVYQDQSKQKTLTKFIDIPTGT